MNHIKRALFFFVIFLSILFGQKTQDDKSKVIETAVYTVKKEFVEEFPAIRAKIFDVLKTFKGFRSVTALHSIEHPEMFSEIIEWECKEDCERARVQAEKIPELQPFLNAIEKSVLFEFFTIEKKMKN